MSEKKYFWADFCRVIATFGVIVIHSSGTDYHKFNSISLFDWISVDLLQSIVRISVPLFFMLSGSLLLNRSENHSVKKVLSRIIRLIVPLIMWSIIYLAYNSYYHNKPIDLFSILYRPAMYHLWFVYSLVEVYIALPLIYYIFNKIVRTPQKYIPYSIVWFILVTIPVFLNIYFMRGLIEFSGNVGYFIVGGLISHFITKHENFRTYNIRLAIFFIASILLTASLSYYLTDQNQTANETAFQHLSPNIVVSSILAFILFNFIPNIKFLEKTSSYISRNSFTIYLCHALVLAEITQIGNFHQNTIFNILLISISTLLVSLILTKALRIIPKSNIIFG